MPMLMHRPSGLMLGFHTAPGSVLINRISCKSGRDHTSIILLRSVQDIGTPFDDIQWAAVLRSASALEMYRKRYGRISPKRVVEFLLLDREFPRAIHFCLLASRDSLHAISGTPAGTFRHAPEKSLGQLCSDLSFTSVDEIVNSGLHEYLDHLQTRMNQVAAGIYETFFALKTPKPAKRWSQSQTQ